MLDPAITKQSVVGIPHESTAVFLFSAQSVLDFKIIANMPIANCVHCYGNVLWLTS
jgi:hypothetical protein